MRIRGTRATKATSATRAWKRCDIRSWFNRWILLSVLPFVADRTDREKWPTLVPLVALVALVVEVETLAAMYWRALQLGKPNLLSPKEMERVLERFKDYGPGYAKVRTHEPERSPG